jgi:hypothetical protein
LANRSDRPDPYAFGSLKFAAKLTARENLDFDFAVGAFADQLGKTLHRNLFRVAFLDFDRQARHIFWRGDRTGGKQGRSGYNACEYRYCTCPPNLDLSLHDVSPSPIGMSEELRLGQADP